MDLQTLIKNYLTQAKVMQVATVHENKPWVCTVNFAFDEKWTLYWMSLRSTRHSQELKLSSFVAGTIVKDPSIVQGLQFEGEAFEVTGEELIKVNDAYQQRYGDKPERLKEAQSEDSHVRSYYKIIPVKFVLFDKVNFPDNPQQEFLIK